VNAAEVGKGTTAMPDIGNVAPFNETKVTETHRSERLRCITDLSCRTRDGAPDPHLWFTGAPFRSLSPDSSANTPAAMRERGEPRTQLPSPFRRCNRRGRRSWSPTPTPRATTTNIAIPFPMAGALLAGWVVACAATRAADRLAGP
jgi:hypothetical protein